MKTIKYLTDFEKEILKQEIELADKTIARIDHIQLIMKDWAIVIWGGSLYLITQYLEKSGALVLLTAIIPFLFGVLDVIWTKQMLVVNYREEKIAAFINGGPEDNNFSLLDPIAKKYNQQPDYLESTSLKKAVVDKGMLLFYLSLVTISIVLGIVLLIN